MLPLGDVTDTYVIASAVRRKEADTSNASDLVYIKCKINPPSFRCQDNVSICYIYEKGIKKELHWRASATNYGFHVQVLINMTVKE
jgi:hypothetical protein